VHVLEPQAAIPSIQTMRQVVASSVSEQRFQVILLGTFAAIAVVLACLGIYGVLAFTISRRTSDIGRANGSRSPAGHDSDFNTCGGNGQFW
jgi:putative ABC transport system permease protein